MTQSASQPEEGYQLCPFCREKIRAGARKCRWCLEYLEPMDAPKASKTQSAPAVGTKAAEAGTTKTATSASEPIGMAPVAENGPVEEPITDLSEALSSIPDESEEIYLKMHPSHKRLFLPLGICLLCILVVLPFLRHMEYSMYALLLIIVACFIWFLKVFIDILTTTYVLDDKRLVVGAGFFTRHKVEIRIEDIRAVWLKQNLLEQLLNVGDVQVGTSATAGAEISIADIDAPNEVHDLLRSLMN